jgi:NAD(P)-dependent dehydrogenase (short-subunit alcohol dehydrogenase family)
MTMNENTNYIETLYRSLAPRYPELSGQTAVVTGAAQGIGLGIAARLAREGMRVMMADLNAEKLHEAVAALRQLDAAVWDFVGDLSQPDAIQQLFEQVGESLETVHVLVNNAAVLQRKRLLEERGTLLDEQLAINVRGPYLCAYHAADMMRAAGGGAIIQISSVGALRAHWRGLPYDVTKGAINAMTRAMAIDLAEYNIRVNAIGPGATRTEKTRSNSPGADEIAGRIPLGRFASVAEISSVVAFLASPEASYITGQVIYVDGGITTQLSPPGQNL